MNNCTFIGRIASDIEMKNTNSGMEVLNISVAVDRAYKKDGEERMTDFVPVTVFGKSAALINQYFHKGDGIIVTGRLESNKYEKDGQKRTAWNVIADRIEFPPSKKQTAQSDMTTVTDQDVPF